MFKKSFAILMCFIILMASTVVFADDNDIPRPKIVVPEETVYQLND